MFKLCLILFCVSAFDLLNIGIAAGQVELACFQPQIVPVQLFQPVVVLRPEIQYQPVQLQLAQQRTGLFGGGLFGRRQQTPTIPIVFLQQQQGQGSAGGWGGNFQRPQPAQPIYEQRVVPQERQWERREFFQERVGDGPRLLPPRLQSPELESPNLG